MKNIQLIKTSNYRLEVEEWVCDRYAICKDEVEDIFYGVECELENRFEDADIDKDLIREVAFDVVSGYAFDSLSIYNDDVVEDLHSLQHHEIDEIIEESGWIEYNGSYADFARCVVGYVKERELMNAVDNIIDQATEINFDRKDLNAVKADIIKHLETYRDAHIEGLAREAKKLQEKEYTCGSYIEAINEYICEMSYCGYMVEDTLENRRKWEAYKFYYIDLYSDKEIKQAVFNYVVEIDEANAEAEKRKLEDIKMINEKAESGEDIEELEVISNTIDRYYYDDEDYRTVYHKLQLRIEYLHTVKYIEDLKNEESSRESKIEQVAETMKAMRNSKSIEELSKFIIELMN